MAEKVDIRRAIQGPLGEIHERCTELFYIADHAFSVYSPFKHWETLEFEMEGRRRVVVSAQEWKKAPNGTVSIPDQRPRFRIEFNPTWVERWHLNRFRRLALPPALSVQTASDPSEAGYFPYEGEIDWLPRTRDGIYYHPNSNVALGQTVDLRGFKPAVGLLARINRDLQADPLRVFDLICPTPTAEPRVAFVRAMA